MFIEALRDNFMHQHVQFDTTFRQGKQSSMLDLVFSSDESLIYDLDKLAPLGKSDHLTNKQN